VIRQQYAPKSGTGGAPQKRDRPAGVEGRGVQIAALGLLLPGTAHAHPTW
jgi:hypothetical protein